MAFISKKDGKKKKTTTTLIDFSQLKNEKTERLSSEIGELDRVLGGGIVSGEAILFSGEPGIGKSTLLTQVAVLMAQKGAKVIYVCGEESPRQIGLRLERIFKTQSLGKEKIAKNFQFITETDVDVIIASLEGVSSKERILLIVDSVQTLTTEDLASGAGSVGQVRESVNRLVKLAKTKQIATFLVGHITKGGELAGPKVIEHIVDAVLYFEGERYHDLRLLRGVKNRFGPTDEVGVFQMTDSGLKEIPDLSFFYSEGVSGKKAKTGSAYAVVIEGTRPMVVEIQALVTQSFLPLPKRVINGLERNRSEMLMAVCQKYLKIPLFKYDIFLNVAGGLKIGEPAADLAICAAIYSSYAGKPLKKKSVFIGEVSLLGEVSSVSRLEKRLKQAKALGFLRVITESNCDKLAKIKKETASSSC